MEISSQNQDENQQPDELTDSSSVHKDNKEQSKDLTDGSEKQSTSAAPSYQPDPNNLSWAADNDVNVFEQAPENKWIEKINGQNAFEFEPVKAINQQSLLLHDPNRNAFVQLNPDASRYGENQNELRPLYPGKWTNPDFENRLGQIEDSLSKKFDGDQDYKDYQEGSFF